MKDIENMILHAVKFRGGGPYLTDDAIGVYRKEIARGMIPFHGYQTALGFISRSMDAMNLAKPDVAPRTWRTGNE